MRLRPYTVFVAPFPRISLYCKEIDFIQPSESIRGEEMKNKNKSWKWEKKEESKYSAVSSSGINFYKLRAVRLEMWETIHSPDSLPQSSGQHAMILLSFLLCPRSSLPSFQRDEIWINDQLFLRFWRTEEDAGAFASGTKGFLALCLNFSGLQTSLRTHPPVSRNLCYERLQINYRAGERENWLLLEIRRFTK